MEKNRTVSETGTEAGDLGPPPAFDHVLGHQYTAFDGLAGMLVEDIYQDREGFLWIATADGGVSRFDGARFDNFGTAEGLPHPNVMSVAEDEEGRLLFATLGGGLAAFDGEGFEVYTTEHGLPSDELLGLQPLEDGSIRLLTRAGIARFAGGRCVESLTDLAGRPLGPVYDLATDAAGTTWLATRERGVVNLEGEPMQGDRGTGREAMQWPWKFALDAAGHLWIAFRYVGSEAVVGRYDPGRRRLDLVKADPGVDTAAPVSHGTRHVRVDDRGWLWMTRRGVLVFDGGGWRPFSPRLPEGRLADARVTCEDREGNIWVGLWGGGLLFCDPLSLRLYTEEEGLPDQEVRCLGEDGEGRLWIGTPGGLARRENGRIRTLEPGGPVSALAEDGRAIWSAGPDGLVFEWTGEEAREIAVGEADSDEEVTCLAADGSGRVWAGTSHGRAGRIEAGRFTALAGRLPNPCSALLPAGDGALWIGAGGSAPALYRLEEGRLQALDGAGMETVSEVSALCEYRNRLWVGTTDHGLFAVDLASLQVRRFSADRGDLTANGVLALAADPRQGCMWIGTAGGGVVKYDGQTFQCIRLGDAALENVVAAVRRDRRGRLWFGTGVGLVAYRPGRTPPGLVIREAEAGRLQRFPRFVSCPEETGGVRILFQGIGFRTGAAQMRYSHRLAGHPPAEAWSEFAPAAEVAYDHLPPGRFRFEVRARDRDGLVSEMAGLDLLVAEDDGTRLQPSARSMISKSPAMARVLELAGKVADTRMTVMILGETGVGKGLLAERIHELSRRRQGPFVPVNCGAIPPGLVESELFGHEKGAFTNAVTRRTGWFEQAHRGTLFLDEVADLSREAQRALLSVLEDRRFWRVGGTTSVEVDVRVIAASNRDLGQAARDGKFREDLLFRLNSFPLKIPPLRDRPEEIPFLAAHFAVLYAGELRKPPPRLSGAASEHLRAQQWPGNVRELQHVIERAVIVCRNGVIQLEDLHQDADHPGTPAAATRQRAARKAGPGAGTDKVAETERQQILEALQAANWVIYGDRGAARLLDMHPERLRSRMRVHGLKRPGQS